MIKIDFKEMFTGLGIIALAILALFTVFALLSLVIGGCTKNITSPGTDTTKTDTVFVTKTVYDTAFVPMQGVLEFYDAAQQWIVPQLSPMASYFPVNGTEDIIATKVSATKYTIDIYWIVVDFDAGQVYIYYGIFVVTYTAGRYTVEDVTPAGMPLRASSLHSFNGHAIHPLPKQ